MPVSGLPQDAAEMPEPDPALVLLGAMFQARLRLSRRRERAALIAEMDAIMEAKEAQLSVQPIRSRYSDGNREAWRKAIAWWKVASKVAKAG